MLFSPLQKVGKNTIYILAPGSTSTTMLDDLRRKKMISAEQALFLKGYLKLIDVDDKIKAGKYRIQARTTPYMLVKQFVAGDVEPSSFRIFEGQTFNQVLIRLKQHPEVKHTLSDDTPVAVMNKIDASQVHYEGWLFPDTYQFHYGTKDIDILRMAYQSMQKHLQQAWRNRTSTVITEPYQALILASIIEKEAKHVEERERVSGVFQRRLAKKMRLQADPTVIYGMGEQYSGNIRKQDLLKETPYNSYVHFGLPPTPISLPSFDSIQAATRPALGEALYFVAKGDGTHHFSATLNEHNLAVQKYQLGQP
jgi:UPF0755 protein